MRSSSCLGEKPQRQLVFRSELPGEEYWVLDIGSFPARTCSAIGRRSFLRLAASAPLGLGLATPGAALIAAEAAKAARAKSVIFVFLWGAPSHLDTFDPKPDAPAEYRGPFGVIPTRTPGVHFTELVP